MALILRESWKNEMISRISQGEEIEYTSAIGIAIRFLVLELTRRNVPFRIMNLGAGVKKITTKVDTCPKCHGTGKV